MGYRSEVGLVITKRLHTESMLKKELPRILEEEYTERSETEEWVCYHWEDIKWYEGYDLIDELMEWLDTLKVVPMLTTTTNGNAALEYAQFGFVRLGEDDIDIEYLGDPGEYEMWVNKSIAMP